MAYERESEEWSELLTLAGATTGAGGTLSMTSDVFVSTITSFVMPKGTTLKVRSRLVAGAAVRIHWRYSNDGTTFRTIMDDYLASAGTQDDELRTPHLFRSNNGTEAVQIGYDLGTGGAGATLAQIAVDVQIEQQE